jgi:Na+-transporting NADH:ubiquinone oxidoreductase subunit D
MTQSKSTQISLFSIFRNNPVASQVLGVCSALAVTVNLQAALIMALAVTVVLACSNVVISLMKNTIPMKMRLIVQLIVVSLFVILIDLILKAFAYNISKQLSIFLGLVITNCLVLGRLEDFAMKNKVWHSFLDGLSNGFGYGVILIIVATIREILGNGTLLNIQIIPQSFYDAGYMNNSLMMMPPFAIIILGIIFWIKNREKK